MKAKKILRASPRKTMTLHINFCPDPFGIGMGHAFGSKLDADVAKCRKCKRHIVRIKIPTAKPTNSKIKAPKRAKGSK